VRGQPSRKIMRPSPLAAIDLGSNTVRLLVASGQGAEFERLLLRQEVTRLGEALKPGEPFLPAAARRTWKVLEQYRAEAEALGAGKVVVGATMAVRQAADGSDFLARISLELGFETLLLSGAQEADLTAAGVMTGLKPVPDSALIFDLGGRSTEFILTKKGNALETYSLEIGAVALTETYLLSDPPLDGEVKACRAGVDNILRCGFSEWDDKAWRPDELVGTAGTTTTLAAMAQGLNVYRPELIDNYRLTREVLAGLFQRILALPTIERALIPGLPRDRADIIAAGAAGVLEIMDFFNTNSLIVSDAGLLEGIWLAAAGQRSKRQ